MYQQYQNNRSQYGQSNNRGYQNRGNYGNSNFKQNNYQRHQKKHSGARETVTKKGDKAVIGWNYSKQKGLVSVACFLSKYSKECESKKGVVYTKLVAYITYTKTGMKSAVSAFVRHDNGKVYIPELQWVLNPKAPMGGYCGTYKMKR